MADSAEEQAGPSSSSSTLKDSSINNGGGMDHDDDDGAMTLKEALEEIEDMEKLSTAVLGASDPKNCSYSKGYLKRQALYACLTCNPKNAPFYQEGGVCLACSYKCHEGHEMVELYTKRNFRCDCGNKKFPDNPCTLQKEKEELNEKNVYSQNFAGLYCTCHRPYPDPDESAENAAGGMVQCVICEDWYHIGHFLPDLQDSFSTHEQSVEMICGGCTPKLKFLPFYAKTLQVILKKEKPEVESAENVEVDVVAIPLSTTTICDEESCKVEFLTSSSQSECDSASQDSGIASLPGTETEATLKTKSNATNNIIANKNMDASSSSCPLEQHDDSSKNNNVEEFTKNGNGTLWAEGWRKKLCCCNTCKDLYDSLGVSYLLDDEDTMENYEAKGKAKAELDNKTAEENFTRSINDLGHVGQIELISGYNDMKEALKTFLNDFATKGKVVREEDVQDFFQNLRATKRPRLDLDGADF